MLVHVDMLPIFCSLNYSLSSWVVFPIGVLEQPI